MRWPMASVNVERPEFVRDTVLANAFGVVQKPLTLGRRSGTGGK